MHEIKPQFIEQNIREKGDEFLGRGQRTA